MAASGRCHTPLIGCEGNVIEHREAAGIPLTKLGIKNV